MSKSRLDVYLVDHSLAPSRSRAQSYIQGEREVYVNQVLITKPSFLVGENDVVEVKQIKMVEFVSRAGYKLAKALETWALDLTGLVCLDIGASTGGFSQCCLLYHAKKVIAVDVGHDQLAPSLQQDSRIDQLDNLNFRYVTTTQISAAIDFYCCDVSFISLAYIIPALNKLNLQPTSFGIFLIKPQFETNQAKIRNGRALDKDVHLIVIKKVLKLFAAHNFSVFGLTPSPLKGQKKSNLEYLLLVGKQKTLNTNHARTFSDQEIKIIIDEAWTLL